MAMRIYGIINMENGEHVLTLQAKRRDMAEKAIIEYINIGRIPAGEYRVELIAKERT